MADADLTPKQALFVAEYLKDLNATQAAIRAGYSAATAQEQGSRLLSNVMVKAAVDIGKSARAERCQIDADYVLKGIRDTVERCQQAVEVHDREGNPTGVYQFEAAAALRGLELLGKHLGLFRERVEITDITKRTDAELEAELVALRAIARARATEPA